MYPTRLNFVRRIDRQGLKIIEFSAIEIGFVEFVAGMHCIARTAGQTIPKTLLIEVETITIGLHLTNCPSNTIGFCSFALLLLCIFCRTESFTVDHLENEVIFLVLGTLPNSMCQRLTEAEHAK